MSYRQCKYTDYCETDKTNRLFFMQSAIFFIPTRIYALFSADSRKIITFYNHLLVDFFSWFSVETFSADNKTSCP